jgi:flagellar biogenesis protein FliO
MDWGLLLRSAYALAVIGLLLSALWWGVRNLGRGRLIAASGRRLVTVIESTYLTQNTTMHVVKIADRYYLVGGGQGHVALICEVPAESVTQWLENQQRMLDEQAQTLRSLVERLRGGGRG